MGVGSEGGAGGRDCFCCCFLLVSVRLFVYLHECVCVCGTLRLTPRESANVNGPCASISVTETELNH